MTAEEKLIAAARERAHQEKTTLNSAFRDWLERYAVKPTTSSRFQKLMQQYRHVSAGRKFSREEMNER